MPRASQVLLPFASFITLVGAIEILKLLHIAPVFLPAPSTVAAQAWRNPGLLTSNLIPTLRTAALGYLISALLTTAGAWVAVSVRPFYSAIYMTSVLINAVPVIATAPLLAVWLGTGFQTQTTIAALACQFPMFVGAIQGLNAVDSKQRELFYILSSTPLQTFWHLKLPSAFPYLFAGLRIAAPLAILGTVTAEWVGADRGIGAMMLNALFSYDVATVWLSVVVCCALASTAYGFIATIEKLVVKWDIGAQR